MRKLLEGIVEFRKKLTPENKEFFTKLALGQKPDALFITCSDSRILPNLLASTSPGDLFVLRNIGNLIPNAKAQNGDVSAQAAIEFSVLSLNVKDIIICGHSNCGAMQALSQGFDKKQFPHLGSWLKYADDSLREAKNGSHPQDHYSDTNHLSRVNVLQQMNNILSYAFIQEKIAERKLRVHGWWFDIGNAEVYCYEKQLNKFVLIDEEESKLILERLV